MKTKVAGDVDAKKILVYFIITLIAFSVVLIPAFIYPQYLGIISTLNITIMIILTIQFYLYTFFGLQNQPRYPENMDWPMVSIIIPSFNEENVLPRSIDAMLAIDYPKDRIEFVYVYEKKGTDKTKNILAERSKNEIRIRPIMRNESTGGKAAATNFGIKQSQGSIVACYDADHSLVHDSVKNAVRTLMADTKVMCVKGRYRTINKDEGILAKVSGIERDIADTLIWYGHDVIRGFTCMGGNAFFKRDIFDELGYFHESTLTEDVDYSLKIHKAGYELRINPDIVSWEESPASLSQWWHQRKRWARGWIQSSLMHINHILTSSNVSAIKKIDTFFLLLLTIIQPLMFLFSLSSLVSMFGLTVSNYYPSWVLPTIGGLLSFSIIIAAIIVWIRDYRKGERFRWDEIIYLPAVAIYMSLLAIVAWIGFIEEFILKSKNEFIKTDRSGIVTTSIKSSLDEPLSS